MTVFFDLDFRNDQWHDPRAYGITSRLALQLTDVAIGTADEVNIERPLASWKFWTPEIVRSADIVASVPVGFEVATLW